MCLDESTKVTTYIFKSHHNEVKKRMIDDLVDVDQE